MGMRLTMADAPKPVNAAAQGERGWDRGLRARCGDAIWVGANKGARARSIPAAGPANRRSPETSRRPAAYRAAVYPDSELPGILPFDSRLASLGALGGS